MSFEIITIPVTPLQQNCRIIVHDESRAALVIDPGGEASRIRSELDSRSLTLAAIWLTHSHLDHCGGVADLVGESDIPLLGHPDEAMMRGAVVQISAMYGLPPGEMKNCPEPSQFLHGGEVLTFQGASFEVRFCPGHSPGHVIFYWEEQGVLFGGDTLFAGSIGRTDLPGGNHELLLEGIQTQIYSLPEETVVLSGHGPDTAVGREMASNPFVRAM